MRMRLEIECTYNVEYEIDVPDDIAEELMDAHIVTEHSGEVYDWLADNVREADAWDCEFSVDEAEPIDQDEEGGKEW